jgi:peptidoglycan/LPS O-acetylase OafA/YrhL
MMTFGHSEYYLDSQLANLLRAPLFALLIYVFAFQAGILSRIFSHPWLVYLGEISFSIYMVHCIVMELYRRWCTPQIHVVSGAIYFLVVFAISSLLFTVLEKPARKAVARLLEGWFGLRRPARN